MKWSPFSYHIIIIKNNLIIIIVPAIGVHYAPVSGRGDRCGGYSDDVSGAEV